MFNFRKGISLISLMVVIIVLGILAVVAIPNIKDIADDTRLSATLENKTNVQKAVDRYLLEKQELPVEIPGDLSIGSPQQVKWDLLSPDYLREKPADLDKIYYWVDYNGSIFASDVDAPQNITINTVLGTTTVTWDEVDGAKSYEVGYIDSSLAHQIQTRSLKGLNASTGSYKVLGIVNSEDTLSFDTTEDLTGKTVVLASVSANFKSVPVKVGYIGSELEAVEGESVPSGPQPLQTEVPDGWIGIYTVEDLDNMRNNLSGKYILMNNLDLGIAPYNEGEGWEPISTFYGVLDGNNLEIKNLYIDKPSNSSDIGLFGIARGSTIRNLKIVNAYVVGKSNVGALMGYGRNDNTIQNITVDAYIKGSTVGGISGHLLNNALIENVYTTGIIEGSSYSGGVVGSVNRIRATSGTTIIKNVYSDIHFKNPYYTGGIAGYIINNAESESPIIIENAYYYGTSENESNTAGLVYQISRYSFDGSPMPIVRNSYWDKDTLQFSYSGNSTYWQGRTTSEMMQKATYTGFDFDTTWTIDEGNDYPRLQWEN